jgi:hypothetical protein
MHSHLTPSRYTRKDALFLTLDIQGEMHSIHQSLSIYKERCTLYIIPSRYTRKDALYTSLPLDKRGTMHSLHHSSSILSKYQKRFFLLNITPPLTLFGSLFTLFFAYYSFFEYHLTYFGLRFVLMTLSYHLFKSIYILFFLHALRSLAIISNVFASVSFSRHARSEKGDIESAVVLNNRRIFFHWIGKLIKFQKLYS